MVQAVVYTVIFIYLVVFIVIIKYLPLDLGWENLRLSDGIHGLAQGAVFIVNVHVLVVNNGNNGETSVSHLPILLQ